MNDSAVIDLYVYWKPGFRMEASLSSGLTPTLLLKLRTRCFTVTAVNLTGVFAVEFNILAVDDLYFNFKDSTVDWEGNRLKGAKDSTR